MCDTCIPRALHLFIFSCYRQPVIPRRGKKPEPDKRSQLYPAVAREVKAHINAKRKEARGMVLNRCVFFFFSNSLGAGGCFGNVKNEI